MNLNPTVNRYQQSLPPITFYSYPVEKPHSINITLANTNLNTNYIVQDSNEPNNTYFHQKEGVQNSNILEKKPRKKSKEHPNLMDELKKERQKNQILILKVIELEKLLDQQHPFKKNQIELPTKIPPFVKGLTPMQKDREGDPTEPIDKLEDKIVSPPKISQHEMVLEYIKSMEMKMEEIVAENEKLSKKMHEQSQSLEMALGKLEEKYNNQKKNTEILLAENEKLRTMIDEIKEKSQRKIEFLDQELNEKKENISKLHKENSVIVNSIAITNERQQIEKNKLVCLSEQNSYLDSKNKILTAEIQKLKGKT